MFHKAKTEAQRQKIFDEYLLGILKKKKVIKINKKNYRRKRVFIRPRRRQQATERGFK